MSLLPIMMWPNILTARPADILRGVAIMTRFGWQGKPGLSVIAGDQPPDLRSIERLQAPVLAPSAVWNDRGQEAACEIEVPLPGPAAARMAQSRRSPPIGWSGTRRVRMAQLS